MHGEASFPMVGAAPPTTVSRLRATEHVPAELAVIVPTLDEEANVFELVTRLRIVLAGRAWEVVFVDDDSRDGTRTAIAALARVDTRVRLLHRIGRRGLASACVEGWLATTAPYVAVMDADLQHDEGLLPRMLEILERDTCDLVVGSRYADGGSVADWNTSRLRLSRLGTRLAMLLLPVPVQDPMSGFFMLRRAVFEARVRSLSGTGFKILLDLLTSGGAPRVVELPYRFRARHAGASKLDAAVLWYAGLLLADRLLGRLLPARFIAFAVVGLSGVGVHVAALFALLHWAVVPFPLAQSCAAVLAMVSNFVGNNALTYRDHRLTGFAWWVGLAVFVTACSLGAVANVGVASYLFEGGAAWGIAGLAGVLVGAVWNYAVTGTYAWRVAAR